MPCVPWVFSERALQQLLFEEVRQRSEAQSNADQTDANLELKRSFSESMCEPRIDMEILPSMGCVYVVIGSVADFGALAGPTMNGWSIPLNGYSIP